MTHTTDPRDSLPTAPVSRRRFLGLAVAGAAAWGLPSLSSLPEPSPRPLRAPSALLKAVRRGELATVRRFLQETPGLAASTDAEGRSLFLIAHLAGQPTVAGELRGRGLELDLVEAIAAGDAELVQAQLRAPGVDANALHPIGGTAYFAAARFGRTELMWYLNRWGGDPNANPAGGSGMTPLRAAFLHEDPRRVEEAVVRMLVDAGDPNAVQRRGDSVLHAAAALGSRSLVELLLELDASTAAVDGCGRTVRQVALEAGHRAVAELLAEPSRIPRGHGSSRFVADAEGRPYQRRRAGELPQLEVNELVEMCHYDFERVQQILRRSPRLIHGLASWDELGVEASAHMGDVRMTEFLLERGAPYSLPTAILMGDAARCRALLDEAPDRVHERGPHHFALLWYPEIAGGNLELAELLLDRGTPVDQHKLGVTLLHRAAFRGFTELVELLLQRGASVNGRGRSDFMELEGTPLDFALARDQTTAAGLLRRAGGKPADELPKEPAPPSASDRVRAAGCPPASS